MLRHINSYPPNERQTIMANKLLSIVKSHGGWCNWNEYINKRTPIIFRCASGHEWSAQPQSIFNGSWCRKCWEQNVAGAHLRLSNGLKQAQDIATKRGGNCLSEAYKSNSTKMKWICANGHQWSAALSDIRKGSWCPDCGSGARERLTRYYFEEITGSEFPKSKPIWLLNDRGNRMELDGFNSELSLAFEHQGEQHYQEVEHFNRRKETLATRLKDDERKRDLCKKNEITLIEVPYFISTEDLPAWIKNSINKLRPSINLKPDTDIKFTKYAKSNELEVLKDVAKSLGGQCLSSIYLGAMEKHHFICSKGHEWKAIAANIKNGTWCPKCKPERISASKRKHTVESMSALARKKGGQFLSSTFTSVNDKYEWVCGHSHKWIAAPSDIVKGTWCPKCAKNSRRSSLQLMQELAISRGGTCLSEAYISSQTKLRWRCSYGHEWEARPDNVKNRQSWCPTCAKRKRTSS